MDYADTYEITWIKVWFQLAKLGDGNLELSKNFNVLENGRFWNKAEMVLIVN